MAIEEIHKFCAYNKVPTTELNKLDEVLEEVLFGAITVGMNEANKKGLEVIGEILRVHLENNVPNEDDLYRLHIISGDYNYPLLDHDPRKELGWEYVSERYIKMLHRLLIKSIKMGRLELIHAGMIEFRYKIVAVIKNKNLGPLQKKYLINSICAKANLVVIECAKEGTYESAQLLSIISPITFEYTSGEKAEFFKIQLTAFSDLLINLAQKNYLDGQMIGYLGENIEDNFRVESMIFFLDLLGKIAEILERNERTQNNIEAYITSYLWASNRENEFIKWMKKKNKYNNNIEKKMSLEKKMSSSLEKFKEIEEYKREYQNKSLNWPNINDYFK
jgi:hypothetical protein